MKMKLGTYYSPFLICASLTRSLCLSFRSEVCDTRHRYERSINFLTRCSVTRPEGSDTLTQSATSTTLTGTATASRLSSTTIRLKEGGRMMTFLAFKITTTDTQANSPQVTVVRRVKGVKGLDNKFYLKIWHFLQKLRWIWAHTRIIPYQKRVVCYKAYDGHLTSLNLSNRRWTTVPAPW